MQHSTNQTTDDLELLRLVVAEVDQARDALELVEQVADLVPINSYEELVEGVGNDGLIRFRGARFDLRAFEAMVPAVVFPVISLQQLVSLAAHVAALIPGTVGSALDDPERARLLMRRVSLRSATPTGRIGPTLSGARYRGTSTHPSAS